MLETRPVPRAPAARLSRRGLGFVALGIGLGAALVASSRSVYAVQGGFAELADLLPVGYAFGAGMVAAVNTCGILLLPSLVAYYVATAAPTGSTAARAGRAMLLAVLATLGFVAVFGAVGLVVGAGGTAVARLFPVGGLAVGIALGVLGGWLALSGEGLGLAAASRAMGSIQLGGLRSLFLFGVAYAVCSLACTLPIFLVVAGTALAAGGVVAAMREFVAYALGMGAVLTVVVVAAALFEGATRRWVRTIVPHVHRLSAAFLLGAGIFIVDYWLRGAGVLG